MFFSICDFLATAYSTSNFPWSDVKRTTLLIDSQFLFIWYKIIQISIFYKLLAVLKLLYMFGFGSLPEFIDIRDRIKIKQPPSYMSIDYSENRQFSQQKKRHHSVLIYNTQDKQFLLNSNYIKDKYKKRKRAAHQQIKQFFQKPKSEKKEQSKWVQNKTIDKYKHLKAKHKLLRAIIKTNELEGVDIHKTAYDLSMNRMMTAYSKIKTHPIDTLLPPKIVELKRILQKQQQIKFSPKKKFSGSDSQLIKLQNNVKWAKKHAKRVDNFYLQLGKSYQLMDQERPGKDNHSLQKQQRQKKQQIQRRGVRRKFLKQIQKRLSKQQQAY